MVLKYGHLLLPGAFPCKVTPDIDFTDEAVVQCDVRIIKALFSGAGNVNDHKKILI